MTNIPANTATTPETLNTVPPADKYTAPPADMYTTLANTRAVLDNPALDQHYSWLAHASDTEIEARYRAHCWHI